MQFADTSRLLRAAVAELLIDHRHLLQLVHGGARKPGSEVNFAHHLAIALSRRVHATHAGSPWDVDLEYNRMGVQQNVKQIATRGGVLLTKTPDVIVHRRGLGGTANNLLTLELKPAATYGRDPHRRLQATRSEGTLTSVALAVEYLNYQFGVYLDLGIATAAAGPLCHPLWRWLERDSPDVDDLVEDFENPARRQPDRGVHPRRSEMAPVFSAEEVENLLAAPRGTRSEDVLDQWHP